MGATLTSTLNKMSSDELDARLRTLEETVRRRGRALENPAGKYKNILTKGSRTHQDVVGLFRSVYDNRLTGKRLQNASDDEKRRRIKELTTYLKDKRSSIEKLRQRHRQLEKDAGKQLTEDEVYDIERVWDSIPEREIPSEYIYSAVLEVVAGTGATHAEIIDVAREKYRKDQTQIEEAWKEADEFVPIY